jgi:hypothetical protein
LVGSKFFHQFWIIELARSISYWNQNPIPRG